MSYDEQRISDQIDGGLYHKNQQEMTQETMTKEQILWNLIIKDPNYIYDFKDYDEFLNEVKNIHGQRILAAMSDWEQQQLSAERESHKKEIERILSAVARGENLADSLNFDGKSELDKERERAGKLVGALKSTILIFNKLGYPKTAEFVKQTIAEYDTQTKS